MLGTEVAQKGVLGAYLFIIFSFSIRLTSGGVFWQAEKRGLMCGHCLRCGSSSKKGGLMCGSGQKRGVFAAAHTNTEHIM